MFFETRGIRIRPRWGGLTEKGLATKRRVVKGENTKAFNMATEIQVCVRMYIYRPPFSPQSLPLRGGTRSQKLIANLKLPKI